MKRDDLCHLLNFWVLASAKTQIDDVCKRWSKRVLEGFQCIRTDVIMAKCFRIHVFEKVSGVVEWIFVNVRDGFSDGLCLCPEKVICGLGHLLVV